MKLMKINTPHADFELPESVIANLRSRPRGSVINFQVPGFDRADACLARGGVVVELYQGREMIRIKVAL
jgi:hypothetical protein